MQKVTFIFNMMSLSLLVDCRRALPMGVHSFFLSGMALVASILAASCACAFSSNGKTSLWNLDELQKIPEISWLDDHSEVRKLRFQGPPFRGNPTEVSALYASPSTLNADAPDGKIYPGIVLLHGGGGKPFEEWVRMWASRGYAALALDMGSHETESPSPGPAMSSQFQNFWNDSVRDRWFYYAPAIAIMGNSVLRSLSEVDSERVAITGVSWGGYVTCLAAALDRRFVVAVSVYGCGYLDRGSRWFSWFEKMTPEQLMEWRNQWDPSAYMNVATVPFLFVNGTEDASFHYPAHDASSNLVRDARKRWIPELRHSHESAWQIPEIAAFIDHYAKGAPDLPRIGKPRASENLSSVDVGAPAGVKSCVLWATSDPGPYFLELRADPTGKSKFSKHPARLVGERVEAELPPDCVRYFFEITDENGFTVTTSLTEAAEQ